jgi:hypothetical protein
MEAIQETKPGEMIGAYPKALAIAMVCHETNRAYCRTIGDNSQPDWADAPEWQTASAVKGVAFHLANPDATASASHESWLKEKQETGWKYGPKKDPEAKEHPCFVPFDKLPLEQQAKDKLFKAIVDALR